MTRTYKTKMRTLPDGEWEDVTITECDSFADIPWFKDLPTAHTIPLRDLTPAELGKLKSMTPAEIPEAGEEGRGEESQARLTGPPAPQ
jgi:hypothetical protein